MKKNVIVLAVAVCFLFICTYPAPAAAGGHRHHRFSCEDKVKVMTRNLYLGADIFKVLIAARDADPESDGSEIFAAVAELFQTVQDTNFPERAEAIANEIWMTRPHLIGLQEASRWFVRTPSKLIDPSEQIEEVLVYDYLDILLDALATRGLNYEVAVENPNADVELPMFTFAEDGTSVGLDDLRMVDRDVILVRTDVDIQYATAGHYSQNIKETIGGTELEFTRGWTAVDADVCGETYHFVNTHLEIAGEPGSGFRLIQAAQMFELLTILSSVAEQMPILLVGDFNSSPEHRSGAACLPEVGCVEYLPPYMQATMGAGYLDAWELIFWQRNGFTSGFDEFVNDQTAELAERIDLILVKPQEKEIKNVIAITTGDKPFSMTPGGLWPSDHAGVVARIRFASPY